MSDRKLGAGGICWTLMESSANRRVHVESGYLVVWEFRPRPGAERAFEEEYGPLGAWARLFGTAEGFVRTELNRDLKDSQRYLTLDCWISKEAYESFRAKHAAEYAAIDRECEALTAEEKLVGEFARVGVD